jgi:glucose/mannose-6-phosphate isomerase
VSILDDVHRIASVDPSGMLGVVAAAAEHWRDGAARARAVDIGIHTDELSRVVVCGMGGSGIAGDVAAVTATTAGVMPVSVIKGFTLPSYVDAHTLVLLVSYSGDTAETNACFDQAHALGAPLIAVATGGRLGDMATAHGFARIAPPAGMQPRAAFPFLASGVLVALERLGVLGDLTGELVEVDDVLREVVARCDAGAPSEDNPAKSIASELERTLPIVWGQDGPLGVAAMRWKTQLNENGKVRAYAVSLPELDHNEIVGFGPGAPSADGLAVVGLRTSGEDPRMARRVDASLEVARGAGARVVQAHASGSSPLAQLASAVLLGDFVSVYLGILRGVDPTPVEAIARLKAELA